MNNHQGRHTKSQSSKAILLSSPSNSFNEVDDNVVPEVSEDEPFIRRFVPDITIERMMEEGEISSQEIKIYNHAVAGFFDVSGFSNLARELEEDEKIQCEKQMTRKRTANNLISVKGQGAEQLVDQLNDTLKQLIRLIRASGGDIIKFAGDAILVVWIDKHMAEQCCLAVECAVSCCNLRVGKLGLHVGIGVGELAGVYVGGVFNRWEFFIAGEACSQSTNAERFSKLGEVVISPEALVLLKNSPFLSTFEFEPILGSNGFVLVKSAVTTPGLLLQFKLTCRFKLSSQGAHIAECLVPGPVKEFLKSGGTCMVSGGPRKLTVIFFLLLDVHLPKRFTDENKVRLLHQCQSQAEAVQESAYHFHATLRQFMLDDKGVVAIVCLGLPPYFHEDNAARACKIANRLLRVHKVNCVAGICTGTVFTGIVGSELRAEYSVAGSCVNLAARFMCKANPREIWVDAQTKQEAESSLLHFDQLPSLPFKGFDQLVDIYSPVFLEQEDDHHFLLRPQSFKRSPGLVGNEKECMELSRLLRFDEPIRTVLLEGDAGSGKTRLVEWAMTETSAKRTILTGADASEINTPFFAWRVVLDSMLALEKTPENTVSSFFVSSNVNSRLNRATSTSSYRCSSVDSSDKDRCRTIEELLHINSVHEEGSLLVTPLLPQSSFLLEKLQRERRLKRASVLLHTISQGIQLEDSAEAMEYMLLLLEETGLLGTTLVIFEQAQYLDRYSWDLLRRAHDHNLFNVRFLVVYRPLIEVYLDHPLNLLLMTLAETHLSQLVQQQHTNQRIFSKLRKRGQVVISTPVILNSSAPPPLTTTTPILTRPGAPVRTQQQPPTLQRVTSSISGLPPRNLTPPPLSRSASTAKLSQPIRILSQSSFQEDDPVSEISMVRIQIPNLSVRESSQLLSNAFHINTGPKLLEFLYKRSKGNPRTLMECYQALLDHKLVSVDQENGIAEQNMVLEDVGDLPFLIPHYTRAILQQQFDNLSMRDQLLLKLCSVIGLSVPGVILASVCELLQNKREEHKEFQLPFQERFEIELFESLEALQRKNVIHRQDPSSITSQETIWVFESENMRNVVYSQMTQKIRQFLHGLIISVYTTKFPLVGEPTLLGNYAMGAGQWDMALRCFQEALRQGVLQGGSLEKGMWLWESCLEIIEHQAESTHTIFHRLATDLLFAEIMIENEAWEEAKLCLLQALENVPADLLKAPQARPNCGFFWRRRCQHSQGGRRSVLSNPLEEVTLAPSEVSRLIQVKARLATKLVEKIENRAMEKKRMGDEIKEFVHSQV